MTRQIDKTDIVGHSIREVLQTPWKDYDGTTACEVLVVLDSGLAFLLKSDQEDDVLRPIADVRSGYIRAEFPDGVGPAENDVIAAVLKSEAWPTIGLYLESGRILAVRDYGTPFRVGPFLGSLAAWEMEDAREYWSDQPFNPKSPPPP